MLSNASLTLSKLSRAATVWLLVGVVLMAVGLRGYRLGSPYLWVDEAESALNALTIVAGGVPGNAYMGQPLFENTMLRPWPGHPEYEFRDLSYSDRGLAVYHSWIPLYAMAAAFRLAGVTSESARQGPPPRNASQAELEYWTVVPRLPALLFSAIFVAAAWGLGQALLGQPAAMAFAFAAATANFFVYAGRQARYYSAALAFDALAGLFVWRACRRGRVIDHVLAGLSIGLLFHVHSVSAVTMGAVYVACLPVARRQPRLWMRVLGASAAGAVLVLPWAIWSGLLDQAVRQPMARDHIDWKTLLWTLPSDNPMVVATLVVGVAWCTTAIRRPDTSNRWMRLMPELASPAYFAGVWLLLSYVMFVLLMPAASFAPFRLRLLMSVPSMLILVLIVTAICRAVRPHWRWLPAVGICALLVVTRQLPPRGPSWSDPLFPDFIANMRSWTLRDGRIYASPNDHLTLTYYSGVPVQSVGAVRRSWLDAYRGDLVIIEAAWFDTPSPQAVQAATRANGMTLFESQAADEARAATMRTTMRRLQELGGRPSAISTGYTPALERDLSDLVREATRVHLTTNNQGTLLTRRTIADWRDFRYAFFHWFVDPEARAGAGLNYRACLERARAAIHPSGFIVLDCRVSAGPPLLWSQRAEGK